MPTEEHITRRVGAELAAFPTTQRLVLRLLEKARLAPFRQEVYQKDALQFLDQAKREQRDIAKDGVFYIALWTDPAFPVGIGYPGQSITAFFEIEANEDKPLRETISSITFTYTAIEEHKSGLYVLRPSSCELADDSIERTAALVDGTIRVYKRDGIVVDAMEGVLAEKRKDPSLTWVNAGKYAGSLLTLRLYIDSIPPPVRSLLITDERGTNLLQRAVAVDASLLPLPLSLSESGTHCFVPISVYAHARAGSRMVRWIYQTRW